MIPPGDYLGLFEGGTMWMSDTPAEIVAHLDFMSCAHGNVLVNGLGIGLVVDNLIKKDCVKRIDVVEIREEVINLVAPFLQDKRVHFHHGDAYTWNPAASYDAIYSDIWRTIDEDNLPQMHQLRRKYQRMTPIHFCWEEDACLRMRKGELG
jgi:spermidine synthase